MAARNFNGAAAATTLVAAISASATSLTASDLSTWAGLTAPFTIELNRLGASAGTNPEVILVGAINTSTGVLSSLTRGYAGTTAVAHNPNETVEHTSSALDFSEANAHVNSTNHPFLTAANAFTNANNYFGANADGISTGSRVRLSSTDTGNATVYAESSAASAALNLRSKGTATGVTSAVLFQDGAGATSAYFSSPSGLSTDDTSFVVGRQQGATFSLQRVTEGAADSGGTGYRLLRVAN